MSTLCLWIPLLVVECDLDLDWVDDPKRQNITSWEEKVATALAVTAQKGIARNMHAVKDDECLDEEGEEAIA